MLKKGVLDINHLSATGIQRIQAAGVKNGEFGCPEAVGSQTAMLVTQGPQKPQITLQHQEQTSALL